MRAEAEGLNRLVPPVSRKVSDAISVVYVLRCIGSMETMESPVSLVILPAMGPEPRGDEEHGDYEDSPVNRATHTTPDITEEDHRQLDRLFQKVSLGTARPRPNMTFTRRHMTTTCEEGLGE